MLTNPEIKTGTESVNALPNVNVMLVDDKEEDLLALELILGKENYNFIKATSGREALRVLLKEKDIAIILMDVHMPLLDGFETARLIRESEKFRSIPIIFLTANDDKPDNTFKGYQTGAVDYMIKPLVADIIRTKVYVFTELYKKTIELERQKKDLIALNRALEKQTEEITRSNKDLEKFAYVASHDMQEPLRTIISYVQLLEEKFRQYSDKETAQYMEYVVNAGYRMRDLITGLLEYSRINRTEAAVEMVDFNLVLHEVIQNLESSIKESKTLVSVGELPALKVNRFQMIQLFQNLISNAIKFRNNNQPEIKIASAKMEIGHTFSVEDNGIGIEPKYAERVFEIFQRLHPLGEYSGMGIGLAICKKIIERHNGKIWLEPNPKGGTIVFFIIPN